MGPEERPTFTVAYFSGLEATYEQLIPKVQAGESMQANFRDLWNTHKGKAWVLAAMICLVSESNADWFEQGLGNKFLGCKSGP